MVGAISIKVAPTAGHSHSHSSYRHQEDRNRANTPENKTERKTSEDIETPKKYAKYPEKSPKWAKDEKNEFIARMVLREEKNTNCPSKQLNVPIQNKSQKRMNSNPSGN